MERSAAQLDLPPGPSRLDRLVESSRWTALRSRITRPIIEVRLRPERRVALRFTVVWFEADESAQVVVACPAFVIRQVGDVGLAKPQLLILQA